MAAISDTKIQFYYKPPNLSKTNKMYWSKIFKNFVYSLEIDYFSYF